MLGESPPSPLEQTTGCCAASVWWKAASCAGWGSGLMSVRLRKGSNPVEALQGNVCLASLIQIQHDLDWVLETTTGHVLVLSIHHFQVNRPPLNLFHPPLLFYSQLPPT